MMLLLVLVLGAVGLCPRAQSAASTPNLVFFMAVRRTYMYMFAA